jgi:hypothetical protein
MKNTDELALVAACAVRDCAYNIGGTCHARAITVGHGVSPACDTFLRSRDHCEDGPDVAGVGACKVSICRHNHALECQAPAIVVGYHDSRPDCLTFADGSR